MVQRRRFLMGGIAAASLAVPSRLCLGSTFPSRPVRWLVGFPPGGGATIATRLMADWLSRRLSQPVVIENRPGAAGNLAVQEAINAPPDGHTLLLLPASAVVSRALHRNLSFDVLVDLAPVAGLIEFALVMLTTPSIPVRHVEEFISYAKDNPAILNLASFGVGTSSHLAGELFQTMTGTKLTHVPYAGEAAALTDLMAGRVHVMFSVLTTSLPHIRAGTVKPLAMAGRHRSPLVPVPTIAETVATGYEANSWLGVAVPKRTANEIITLLNREISAGLVDSIVENRLAALGASPMLLTPEQFEHYMVAEAAKWGSVIRSLGLKEG